MSVYIPEAIPEEFPDRIPEGISKENPGGTNESQDDFLRKFLGRILEKF